MTLQKLRRLPELHGPQLSMTLTTWRSAILAFFDSRSSVQSPERLSHASHEQRDDEIRFGTFGVLAVFSMYVGLLYPARERAHGAHLSPRPSFKQ